MVFSVRCSIETFISIHRMPHENLKKKKTLDKFSYFSLHCFEINIRILSFRFSFRPIAQTTNNNSNTIIGHTCTIMFTVACLFRFMGGLVGCIVCLMHIYLPTVYYYYSWENCTTSISFSCFVTTKMVLISRCVGIILASENQNIYRKWSSIRHKQVINNINRSRRRRMNAFPFVNLRIRTKV